MEIDQEAPPLLVASDGPGDDDIPDLVQSEIEDLSLTKVPITVVTGN